VKQQIFVEIKHQYSFEGLQMEMPNMYEKKSLGAIEERPTSCIHGTFCIFCSIEVD